MGGKGADPSAVPAFGKAGNSRDSPGVGFTKERKISMELLAWLHPNLLNPLLAVGKVSLELQDTPAWPGGVLRGVVLLAKPLPTRAVPELHFYCEKRVTRGSGEDRSTIREKIWSARETLSQDRVTRDFTGFRLPVSMALPADGPESGRGEDDSEQYVWKLELKVPGTAVHSVFEIPVFRNGKSPALMAAAAGPSISQAVATDLPAMLAGQRIEAEFDHGGRRDQRFHHGRSACRTAGGLEEVQLVGFRRIDFQPLLAGS